MIDKALDTAADRELHEQFIDVYRQHLSEVTLWPPMDVYELFWRLGRSGALHDCRATAPASVASDRPPPTPHPSTDPGSRRS